jgi:uncharacterized UBP type Zn finger protein
VTPILKWNKRNSQTELGVSCLGFNLLILVSVCRVEYQLIAFISHMGTSAMTGHYVCHVWKDGRWVIFNDNKVAESITPPKDLAYMYFYRRLNQ